LLISFQSFNLFKENNQQIRNMLRGITILVTFLVLATFSCHAMNERYVSEPIPLAKTIEEFIDIQKEHATTPQGGAAMFIQALIQYSSGSEELLGESMMINAIHESDLVNGNLSYSDRYRLARVQDFMARSYVDGTSPDDCYSLKEDADSIQLAFRNQTKYVGSIEQGRYKVFIYSGDSELRARPMQLRLNDDGLWKTVEFSSQTLPVQNNKKCRS